MKTNDLGRAIKIASVAFEGVYDKGGQPYILHCLWVMNKVRHLGKKYMIVAVLHDLLEDTDWELDDLLVEDFTLDILKSIYILTKEDGEVYEEYIDSIGVDKMALEVKLRDLEHNSKITRLKGLRSKDFDRIKKYNEAYKKLKIIRDGN